MSKKQSRSAQVDPATLKLSLSPEEAKKRQRMKKLVVRWGGHHSVFSDGFVPVPRNFFKFAALMKPFGLNPAQMLFVLNLVYHKWDAARPFPSYKTLAARMGISVAYARDIARDLQAKGLLDREVRVGRTNKFDLQPLFDALAQHVEAFKARQDQKTATPKGTTEAIA